VRRPDPLLAFVLCATVAAGEGEFLGYAGVLGYAGNTARSGGQLVGAYAKLDPLGPLCVETGVEAVRIAVNQADEIRQGDATLLLGLHPTIDSTARLGVHAAYDLQRGGVISRTVVADAQEADAGGWWHGLNVALSHFTVTVPEVYAVQASPRGGWSWQACEGLRLEPSLEAAIIGLDRDPGFGRHHYVSAEANLTLRFDHLALDAGGWAGSRCYHVANQGFVVYNLPALYRHGWSAGLSVDLWSGTWLRLQGGQDSFLHLAATSAAQADRFVLMFGSTF